MRCRRIHSLPAWRPAIASRHGRIDAAFVKKNQALRIDALQFFVPDSSFGFDVGPVLFGSTYRLFFRVIPSFLSMRSVADVLQETPAINASCLSVASGLSLTAWTSRSAASP